MFEDQYELAESNLDYALLHCHKDALRNKRCILRYLVPVKMLRGRLPTHERKCPACVFVESLFVLMEKMNVPVLEKYQLNEFIPLVDSIKTGDLRTFNDGLLKYQDLFIRYAESLWVDILDF